MNTQWILDTHGDPIGAVRRLIHTIWSQNQLEGMLVPLYDPQGASLQPRILDDPAQLSGMNPFNPLMIVNDARLVPAWMQSRPYDRLGVVLRPCEMRALIEMAKRAGLNIHRLLTICIDCLGTYPPGDYQWRAARKGSTEALEGEALQFARQGGIVAYRYRSACQACSAPQAQGADLNIGVIGLPVRQHILVEARDEETAGRIHLDRLSDGEFDPALAAQRERTLAKMAERRRHTQDRLLLSLADLLPAGVEGLLSQFERCADCQACMAVCPICEVDFPKRGEDGRYPRADILRWLASCAGCGMCEQACPSHLPLSAIFSHLRRQLVDPLGYLPGRSVDEPLPVF